MERLLISLRELLARESTVRMPLTELQAQHGEIELVMHTKYYANIIAGVSIYVFNSSFIADFESAALMLATWFPA